MSVSTPVVSPNPYADVEDLTNFWKTPDNETRALDLLTRASNRLRSLGALQGRSIDNDVNASPSYFSTVQWVVLEAVKRAMLTPDGPPVDSMTQTAGPYSSNIQYTNPAGDLWFKKSELHDLGLYGNQKLTSISTVPGSTMYDPYESS